MGIVVLTSTVADGSMYTRKNPFDSDVIANRITYLDRHNISVNDTSRLNPNANQRAEIDHETNWCRYLEIDSSSKDIGMQDDSAPAADGLITTENNHALFLPVADCVGAVFYDPVAHVLGLAHLGRHSLEQQGGVVFVQHLQKTHGSNPMNIKVWLSPAPGKDVYPIWALDNKGMKEVTFQQLRSVGILDENITDNPAETDKDVNYFSYSEFLKGNREVDGDHAIVVMMSEL